MTHEVALLDWKHVVDQRDVRVRDAYLGGMSKERIHQITGLARTTIDRIVADLDKRCPCCNHKAKEHES